MRNCINLILIFLVFIEEWHKNERIDVIKYTCRHRCLLFSLLLNNRSGLWIITDSLSIRFFVSFYHFQIKSIITAVIIKFFCNHVSRRVQPMSKATLPLHLDQLENHKIIVSRYLLKCFFCVLLYARIIAGWLLGP